MLSLSSACKNEEKDFKTYQKDGGMRAKGRLDRVQDSRPVSLSPSVEVGDGSEKLGVRDAYLANLLGLKGAEFNAEFDKGGDPVETAIRLLTMTEEKKKSFIGFRIGSAMKGMPTEYVKMVTDNLQGSDRRECLQVFVNQHLKQNNSDRLYETFLAMNPGETRTATAKTLVRHDYFKIGFEGAKNRITQFPYISEQRNGIVWLVENVLKYEEPISEEDVISLLETAKVYGALEEAGRKFRMDERTRDVVAEFANLTQGDDR